MAVSISRELLAGEHTNADSKTETGRHSGISRQTKIGFGLHWIELQALTPKSWTGQIM